MRRKPLTPTQFHYLHLSMARSALLVAALGLVAGCQGKIDGGMNPTGSGGAGSGSGSGGAGSGSGGDPGEPEPWVTPIRRLTHDQFERTVRDVFKVDLDDSLPDEGYSRGLNSTVVTQNVSSESARIYLEAAFDVAQQVVDLGVDGVLGCSLTEGAAADRACVSGNLGELAALAWRRPVSDADIQDVMSTYDSLPVEATTVDRAMTVLATVINSPEFWYLVEFGKGTSGAGAGAQDGKVPLAGYEIAARMSYLLWNSAPDAELREAAANGELATLEGRMAQFERMAVAQPIVEIKLTNALVSWLEIASANELRERVKLPIDDATLRVDEVKQFVSDWVTSDGTFADFYSKPVQVTHNSEFTEPNGMYPFGVIGLPGYIGSHTTSVTPEAVTRGVFVIERLLCGSLPSPPEDVPEIDPDVVDPLAAHTANPVCASCHNYIDPYGLAFESFDLVGNMRKTRDGTPLRTEAVLAEIGDIGGVIRGTADFSAKLAVSDTARECVAELFARAAVGKADMLRTDPTFVRAIASSWKSGEDSVLDLVRQIVASPEFICLGSELEGEGT